jgi:hypothetical protein
MRRVDEGAMLAAQFLHPAIFRMPFGHETRATCAGIAGRTGTRCHGHTGCGQTYIGEKIAALGGLLVAHFGLLLGSYLRASKYIKNLLKMGQNSLN